MAVSVKSPSRRWPGGCVCVFQTSRRLLPRLPHCSSQELAAHGLLMAFERLSKTGALPKQMRCIGSRQKPNQDLQKSLCAYSWLIVAADMLSATPPNITEGEYTAMAHELDVVGLKYPNRYQYEGLLCGLN